MWIPELKDVPTEYLQTPWRELPDLRSILLTIILTELVLNDASKLGGYPSKPIVELGQWKKHYPGGGGSKFNNGSRGRGGGGGGRGRGGGGGGGGRGGGRGGRGGH